MSHTKDLDRFGTGRTREGVRVHQLNNGGETPMASWIYRMEIPALRTSNSTYPKDGGEAVPLVLLSLPFATCCIKGATDWAGATRPWNVSGH